MRRPRLGRSPRPACPRASAVPPAPGAARDPSPPPASAFGRSGPGAPAKGRLPARVPGAASPARRPPVESFCGSVRALGPRLRVGTEGPLLRRTGSPRNLWFPLPAAGPQRREVPAKLVRVIAQSDCADREAAGGAFPHRSRGRAGPAVKNERSTEIGKLLSAYLEKKSNMEDHTVHLLFSANRWEQVPLIKEKLSQGVTLVVDRYAFSGVAFTSAKENFSLNWCKQPDVGLPKPDLILFLQLSSQEAAKRGDFGTERYENNAFQEKALQCFYQLMKDDSLNWKTIDASQSIEDLHKEIYSLAEETIQMVQETPMGELWK